MNKIVFKTPAIPALYEEQEQRLFVDWMEEMKESGKNVKFTHVPNSTYTKSWNQKRKNTYMGVRAGFPDLIIIVNKHIVFIEMKRSVKSKMSAEQISWFDALEAAGAHISVCHSFEEAKQVVTSFL